MIKSPSQKEQNTRSSSGLSDQLSYEIEKKRKFFIKEAIYFVYFAFRIIIAIVILKILNQNFINELQSTDAFNRMQQNIAFWKQDVILNITVVNSYNCPQGYETYTAHDFPGTKEGCYCHALLEQWDYIKVLQGACSQLAISAGCLKLDPIPKIPFKFWKENQLICLKRIKNLDFFTDLSSLNISSKTCSNNQDYRIDIPNSLSYDSCPITNIKNDSSLPTLINQIGFSMSRQDQYPIIGLKMTQYDFCSDFSKDNISPGKQAGTNYNLENIIIDYCPAIDERVVTIDSITQAQLFQNNPRVYDAIKTLPAYPEPVAEYYYKLGFIRYPEWIYFCRKSSKLNLNIAETHFNLEQISAYATTCLNICSIFTAFYGLLFSLFYVYRKFVEIYYKNQQNLLFEPLKEIQRKKPNLYEKIHKTIQAQLIIFGIKFLVQVSTLIVLTVFSIKNLDYFDWYKSSQQCTSDLLNGWTQIYEQYFQHSQSNLLVSIILILTLLSFDIIIFCWRTFKQDLKHQNQQDFANIFDEQLDQKSLQNQTQGNTIAMHTIERRNAEEILISESNELLQGVPQRNQNPKRVMRRKRITSAQISDFTDEFQV